MMEFVNGKGDIPYMKWKIKDVWNHQPVYLSCVQKVLFFCALLTLAQFLLSRRNSLRWCLPRLTHTRVLLTWGPNLLLKMNKGVLDVAHLRCQPPINIYHHLWWDCSEVTTISTPKKSERVTLWKAKSAMEHGPIDLFRWWCSIAI